MMLFPGKHLHHLSDFRWIGAALFVLVTISTAMAAEPQYDWQYEPDEKAAATDGTASGGGQVPAPTSGPIRILPPSVLNPPADTNADMSAADEDLLLFPSGPGADATRRAPVQRLGARPGESGSGIEMGTLGQVDEGSVGLLDNNNGGLGAAMWRGTGRPVVERLLGQVPGPTRSVVMGDLSRRLLLTAARPPQGPNSGVSLLALRLRQLNAAGRADDIVQLLVRSGGARPSAAAAMEFAKGALGVGDTARACNMLGVLPVGGDLANDPIAAFALKLSIFCQISAGQTGAANLTMDLAREQGLGDAYFLALAAQATDGLKLSAATPGHLDALTFRMMQVANRAWPGDVVVLLEPNLLVSVAADRNIDPEIQVAAAERAAGLGLLSSDEMAAAYLSVPYSREDVDGVRIGREPASPYRRRALFHQAVLDEMVPAGRADILSTLFFREARGEAYRGTVMAHMRSLSSVPPSGALTSFAPLAARAFVEQGDRVRAGMWLAVLEGHDGSVRQQRELRAALRLIDPGALVSPRPPEGAAADNYIPAILQDALDDLARGGKPRDFAAMEIVLLDALGFPIAPAVWDALLAAGDLPGGIVPPPAMMRKLQLVSANGQVGETVLLVLAGLAEAGPSGTHPKSLGEMVSALAAVGLEEDARRLAVEALLARASEE